MSVGLINFNGIDLSGYFTVNSISGRGVVGYDINTVTVVGRDGERYAGKYRPSRELEVSYTIPSENAENLREIIDELNAILNVTEPVPIVFSDEPDKTYFGVPEDASEDGEFVRWHQGEITFLCTDPYKYGPEREAEFPADVVTLRNNGSAEASPIFEMEVQKPITFAMIQNQNEEYQLVGRPVDEDSTEQVVDTKSSVLYENGSTIDTWATATQDMVDSNFGNISGTMGSDSSGIRANGYGTGDKVHGPAVFKELPETLQDFEIETSFDIHSVRASEVWRMEIYLHDENMNMLAKIGVKDNNSNYLRRHGLGRVGPYVDSRTGYAIGSGNYLYDDSRQLTLMYLRVRREGQRYTFYIAQWLNLKHTRSVTSSYNDVNNRFQGKLKYITLFIGKHRDFPTPSRLRINSVEVFEYKTYVEDTTPYIAYPGDIITFDHAEDELLINGEDRSELKDFGGSFFNLSKGENMFTVLPSDSLATTIRYREKYH